METNPYDVRLGCGTTDDARFIGDCIARGALPGLVTAMVHHAAGERHV
jgi:hypothetical protein